MVEVFSTNIETEAEADLLVIQILKKFPAYRVNFDLEDCDNILRVAHSNGPVDTCAVIKTAMDLGYAAEALPDIPVSAVVANKSLSR